MNALLNSPADSLKEETQAAGELLELLRKEQDRLIAADIDGLTAVTEDKTRLINRLSELAGRRYQALSQAGFDARESGMAAWIADKAPASAKQSWNTLLDMVRQAKELNRINGSLIGKHLVRNQGALAVLQGGSPQGNQTLYGPNGQSSIPSSARGLAIG